MILRKRVEASGADILPPDGSTLVTDLDARASKKPDKEIAEALKMVQQLALRTNVRQPFTQVLLQ